MPTTDHRQQMPAGLPATARTIDVDNQREELAPPHN
jgi:hypothetical protein